MARIPGPGLRTQVPGPKTHEPGKVIARSETTKRSYELSDCRVAPAECITPQA